MSVESLSSHEVEQDRQRQVRELCAESGAEWIEGYRPGSAGCHELLDRAALVAEVGAEHLSVENSRVESPA